MANKVVAIFLLCIIIATALNDVSATDKSEGMLRRMYELLQGSHLPARRNAMMNARTIRCVRASPELKDAVFKEMEKADAKS
ncbi:hypothetical protein Ancab_019571 [Ancistrocladus abbreviatus]